MLSVFATTVQAKQDYYWSASYGVLDSDVPGDTFTTHNLFAKIGKNVTPNLSVEGLIGFGISDDEWTSETGCDKQNASTDNFIGVQLIGHLPVSPKFSFHGNFSFIKTKASLENIGVGGSDCYGGDGWSEKYSDDDTGLGYGVGLEYSFSDKSSFTADYQILYDDSIFGVDLTIGGFLVGFKRTF